MDGHQLAMSAAVMVQDKLLLDAVTNELDAQDPNVQKLQSSVNSALSEIARDFPLSQTEDGASVWETYDDIDVANCVSMDMLANLVARNYCILCGRLDEADIFDNRYEQYAVAIRLRRRAKLPPRAFV